jgi:hypothetical protein
MIGNKTLKMFLNGFVHFICKRRLGNNITKVSKPGGYQISASSSRCSR